MDTSGWISLAKILCFSELQSIFFCAFWHLINYKKYIGIEHFVSTIPHYWNVIIFVLKSSINIDLSLLTISITFSSLFRFLIEKINTWITLRILPNICCSLLRLIHYKSSTCTFSSAVTYLYTLLYNRQVFQLND